VRTVGRPVGDAGAGAAAGVAPKDRLNFLSVVAAGRLVAPFGFVPNGLFMYISYPKARATDPQVVAFRDWLLEIGRE
jgi:DNA-binding transcriptional LysR family regulator